MNVRVTVPTPPANLSPEQLTVLQQALVAELVEQLREAERSGVNFDALLDEWDRLAVNANLSTEMRNAVLQQAGAQFRNR